MRALPWLPGASVALIWANLAGAECPAALAGLPRGRLDLSRAVAVGGAGPRGRLRMSGIRVEGESYVADVVFRRGPRGSRTLPGSVTRSEPPRISNLQAQVYPGDTAICGDQTPVRVQFSFDYVDCNADVLGGRAVARLALTSSGATGKTIVDVERGFLPPNPRAVLSSPMGSAGTATVQECIGSDAERLEASWQLIDADGNRSLEALTIVVTLPVLQPQPVPSGRPGSDPRP